MPSKQEILDQIAAMQAEADAMGDDEDEYEVEIWNEKGEGARLGRRASEPWLKTKFPELFPEPAPEPPAEGEPPAPKKTRPAGRQAQSGTATKYFGKRPAGK